MKLSKKFYNQSTLKVAKKLLGKFLVRKIGKKKIVGMITEIEAYVGPNDLASHASKGKTPRTQIMFGEAGRWYVYLIYGMYHCLNVVTEKEDYPAAVLIRAVKPVVNVRRGAEAAARGIGAGPGKVCKYFKIDKKLNGENAGGQKLWIEDRKIKLKKSAIQTDKRIGVDYAGKYKHKKWRFLIKN